MSTHLNVQHKRLGRGKLLRTLNNGQLFEVQFESGRRFTLPSTEFEPLPAAMPHRSFEARQIIEALRMGIAPTEQIVDLTVGLSDERKRLQHAFERTRLHGGATLAVLAGYGHGKTHFITLAAQSALSENFLVCAISLDQREVPPSRAKLIYQTALGALRYPDRSERGLAPLLELARQQPETVWLVIEQAAKGEDCPFAFGIRAYLQSEDDADRSSALRYLMHQGGLKRAPRLMSTGNVARQYAYLLSAISTLARALGYSGIALMVDEVDYYSRLVPAAQERAKQFFQALIYASQGEDGTALHGHRIPDHERVGYPLRFSDQSALFFLFASTYSPDQMPITEWLSPALLIYPNQRFAQLDVEHFLRMVGMYHARAYQYEMNGRVVMSSLVSILIGALNKGILSVRDFTQIAVTFYDLLYTRPNVPPEEHIRTLAHALHSQD
ncbi:MAG: BREX system ATP-binding domain-containing protein [Aggregatilineales bacterium]